MFETIASSDRSSRRRRLPFVAGAAAFYVGVGALVLGLTARRGAASEAVVPVRIVAPRLRAAGPPPAPKPAAPQAKRPPSPHRLVQPRPVPMVEVAPPPEPEPDEEGGASAEEGVVGGAPESEGGNAAPTPPAPPPEPPPARPADLASVRAAIARTLVYPAMARRHSWKGTVVLAFVLLANGGVDELVVREGSGFKVLDEAAVAAIRGAVPFPAPGMAVRVVIPLVFDVHD